MLENLILDDCSQREQHWHVGRASATARYAERTMTTMTLIAQTRGLSHAYPLHTSIAPRPSQPERPTELFRHANGRSVRIGERIAMAQVFGRWGSARDESANALSRGGSARHKRDSRGCAGEMQGDWGRHRVRAGVAATGIAIRLEVRHA